MPEIFLFAGPTLARAKAIQPALELAGIHVRPPIARGDVPRLVAEQPPGVLAIVDGRFHQVLAVGHVEIRDAIDAGWAVWGLASLGAIRARELHGHGMRGFGAVFERYVADDLRDDEVTLLHEPEPPYRELSEPLLHLRLALAAALPAADAATIAAELDQMYFGDRTLAWLKQRLGGGAGTSAAYDAVIAALDRSRLKALDLIAFVAQRAWER